ncbi:MAG: PP2C family protein-serine/threonine phosphatase [Terracidiphilus sp.]
MARMTRLYLCTAAIFACAVWSMAQTPATHPDWTNPRHFDPFYLGTRVALGPNWLFSAGDNPAFALPDYDDSGWKTVSLAKPLLSYGARDMGHAWYRIHVHVNPRAHELALEIQYIEGSYEVYANGVRIGAIGSMNSKHVEQGYLTSYDIPRRLFVSNGDLLIAIRLTLNKTGASGVGTSTPFQDSSVMLSTHDGARRDASYEAAHQTVIPWMLSGLGFLVGMVALALYLSMRSRTEYLAIAVSLLASSFQLAEIAWSHLHILTVRSEFFETLWLGIVTVALIEFVRLILHLRRGRWLLALEVANFLGFFGPNLGNLGLLSFTPVLVLVAYFLPSLIVQTVLPVLLLRGLLRGNRDARVILPAIAVVSVANYWNFLNVVTGIWHLPLRVPPLPDFFIGSYDMNFWGVWSAIYFVTLLLFVVIRTIGIARERARATAELEAARAVQHVLVPEDIPAIPGFALASVYKPAGEVGGDFFQILPLAAGGVLVAIGDVSGKGMPAAMTVSLLVGTLRTLAHYTQSPSEILSAMNMRMLARSHGGFTTCLVLRADPNGTLTVANAGHIAPYLSGKEISVENGLPLGLAPDSQYPEAVFQAEPNSQITLVTDGVIEARGKAGELFGFERAQSISKGSAESIAQAAQEFGQDDDITVVTLTRVDPQTQSVSKSLVPALSPSPA